MRTGLCLIRLPVHDLSSFSQLAIDCVEAGASDLTVQSDRCQVGPRQQLPDEVSYDRMALLPENTCLEKKTYTGLYLIKQKNTDIGNSEKPPGS
ncbi:MAG: hypothetical protein J4F49_08335 [Rhodobacteraceae bacterium]|nr:hypothetical protein [Paracoccaceae bacterium]